MCEKAVDVALHISMSLWDEKEGPVGYKLIANGNTYEQYAPLAKWQERACISNLARSAEILSRDLIAGTSPGWLTSLISSSTAGAIPAPANLEGA